MDLTSALAAGFLLGIRHATDADHVVAVTTIVTAEKSVARAAVLGATWGAGHTLSILLVGGSLVVSGIALPPRLGLTLELGVAVMLVTLGVLTLGPMRAAPARRTDVLGGSSSAPTDAGAQGTSPRRTAIRSLVIGVVHGLAGSAGLALLVAATMGKVTLGLIYLVVLGLGTACGMTAFTVAIAAPLVHITPIGAITTHLRRFSGVASIAFGCFLAYEITVGAGLLSASPTFVPR